MDDILIFHGSAVKSLDGGKIGGYLVRFGKPDLAGDFFTHETDFGFEGSKRSPVFLNHRLPFKSPNGKMLRVKERIGEATLTKDEDGVLIEAILFNRKRYEAALAKMGWSSGTANWLVDREKVGKAFHIKSWPLGVDASLTWEPCDPGNVCMSLKSFAGDDYNEDDEFKSAPDDDSFFEPIEPEVKTDKSTVSINVLPDGCFAYIEPGGERDKEAKTLPRSMRYFVYKDEHGKPNEARVREALVAIPQSNVSAEAKSSALAIIQRAAKTLGIDVESGESLTFSKHFQSVGTAVEEQTKAAAALVGDVEALVERIRDRLEFREAKDGRTLAASQRERLDTMVTDVDGQIVSLTAVKSALLSLSEAAKPKPRVDPEAGNALALDAALAEAARFEELQFQMATRHR